MLADQEWQWLHRCVALAEQALNEGNEPFGSVLVTGDGQKLAEDRNRVHTDEPTYHPEIALARWAAVHLTPQQCASATVYTSGEHCPMCAAAHGWAGLGRIVYISSAAQLTAWLSDLGLPSAPVAMLPAEQVSLLTTVEGPVPELSEQVHALHKRCHI